MIAEGIEWLLAYHMAGGKSAAKANAMLRTLHSNSLRAIAVHVAALPARVLISLGYVRFAPSALCWRSNRREGLEGDIELRKTRPPIVRANGRQVIVRAGDNFNAGPCKGRFRAGPDQEPP